MNQKRKQFFVVTAVIAALALIFAAWMIWGNVTVGVTHYSVVSSRLPASFHQYRILILSDLHNAEFGENNSQLIEIAEKENPDMIALTGDLIDSSRTDITIAEKLVKELVKIAPCYYVTGNHEAWIGEQYQELERLLEEQGVTVLHDTSVQLTKGEGSIQLAGLDDPNFTDRDASIQASMLQTKLERMNLTDAYCILLSHRPEAFEVYAGENIDLVLSGHAHGGQFRLPFIGGMVAPNQGLFPKYDAGVYAQGNTTMVVGRGIGNSIIPIRFNNRPEIVSVELLYQG